MIVCIVRTSCRCGGDWAWMEKRPSGAWEMRGCICHHPIPHNAVITTETFDILLEEAARLKAENARLRREIEQLEVERV